MPRLARFVLFLIVGLALLTLAVSGVVDTTARGWFERDVSTRSHATLLGARDPIRSAWYGEPGEMQKQLGMLRSDERVMGAVACDTDLSVRARTPGFPDDFGCFVIGSRLRSVSEEPDGRLEEWDTVASLPSGRVQVSVMPIGENDEQLGFVILLNDLSYIDRREAAARKFVFGLFGLLGIMAFGVPWYVNRIARHGWSKELRGILRGKQAKPEFQPILSDLRELVDRMANEREDVSGRWTADTLKQTLNRYLHGEKILIVANREPYVHHFAKDGTIEVQHPASGLVTALEPVMRACSGVWIGHGSGSADRATVDKHDRIAVPPGEESYRIRRVWLTEEEEAGYYFGFSNEGLWPLCHVAHARPVFREEDWKQYKRVNEKFADAVCDEADTDAPIILIQDYHFALAPAAIRRRLPNATVIMFWHIPWPSAERIGMCPWRTELIDGLLGASILGFHTQMHCNNFVDSVDRYLETRIDREGHAIVKQGHRTLIRPYPISIDWPVRWLESVPSPEECRASVWRDLGLADDALLGVGVDRLDYTKGVEERLLAVERMLERYPQYRGRFSFVQLAAPSRTKIERYQDLNITIERLAERINARFGEGNYRPIILLRSHHEPPTVFRYYRAADVCYVSSLHDGMNLVAKEFVAARTDLRGVLVLSEFTGAAKELTEALIVNPYDLERSSEALAVALGMPDEEQEDRLRSMRSFLSQYNVYRWAGTMLVDAARLRSQERVADRLGERAAVAAR